MGDELKRSLEKWLKENKALCVKIDAGTVTPESLGYNPKIVRDECNLISQLLYLQEVKAEMINKHKTGEEDVKAND